MDEKNIIALIRQNKTKEALRALQSEPLAPELKKALSILESEFTGLNQEVVKGTVSSEEKQIRTNRINDKLLFIVQEATNPVNSKRERKRKINQYLLPLGLLAICLIAWNYFNQAIYPCPEFTEDSRNKILLIPFDKVGDQEASPHLLLRDRITQLSMKNNLSTTIKLGAVKAGVSIEEAPDLAKGCQANVIIWGKYSNRADEIHLVLQYYFLDQPDWSNLGELIVLKDVTAIQSGTMLKNIDDAILSLCSVIAMRQGNTEITRKWLGKIGEKEAIDEQLSEVIERINNQSTE